MERVMIMTDGVHTLFKETYDDHVSFKIKNDIDDPKQGFVSIYIDTSPFDKYIKLSYASHASGKIYDSEDSIKQHIEALEKTLDFIKQLKSYLIENGYTIE